MYTLYISWGDAVAVTSKSQNNYCLTQSLLLTYIIFCCLVQAHSAHHTKGQLNERWSIEAMNRRWQTNVSK